jgi:hypothetical protein
MKKGDKQEMSVKLKLNTLQRIKILQAIGTKRQPDNVALNRAMKLMDKLDFSGEDVAKVGLRSEVNGQMRWDDPKYEFEIELSQKHVEMIKETIEPKNANWDATDGRNLKSVFGQLGIDLGNDEDE